MNDRKTHWDRVYADKSPLEVSWYQKEPSLSLRLIADTGVVNEAPIIDVGGGASLLVDRLVERGYTNVSVLDISANALAHVKQRLADNARMVEWFAADVTDFTPPHTYAVWHDRAVFHFLTDSNDQQKYLDVLKRALRPNGHLIIAAFAIDGPTQCSGLDIAQYDARKIGALLGRDYDLVEELAETHITPSGNEQKFNYFRFVKNA